MTRGPDILPRKLRPAPVRDGLRPSRQRPRSELRARWTAKALEAGRCVACGQPRGPSGTRRYCRGCADRHAARERERERAKRQDAPPVL